MTPFPRAAAVTAAAIAAILSLAACTSEQPRDEVVLYYSADEHVARPVIDAFTRETGVRVRALGDTEATKNTGLAQRLRIEHARGSARADVFWSGEVFFPVRLADEGVLEPLAGADTPPNAHARPNTWHDPASRWFGFAARARVAVINTDALPDLPPGPFRVADLINPVYKNRIVIARPEFGTTRGHFAALLDAWGEDAYREWLRGLRANGARLLDGNSAVVRAVAAGEAHIGLTDTDDVYAGLRNNWPVALRLATDAPHDSAHPGAPLIFPNTVARVAGGPNSANARRLINFLLSEKVERVIARSDSHNTPTIESLRAEYADTPAGLIELDPAAPRMAYERIAELMDRAVEIAREELGG